MAIKDKDQAGTGTRLVTATSTGSLGNATAIAGAYIWADNQTFSGPITGVNATFSGTLTGTLTGSITGNAATATALQTARAINGVNFDGTAPITVTAAAGTLTGATLASNVLASSLTSVGTISAGLWNGTAITDTYVASSATWNAKMTNPMTTAGDVILGGSSGTPTRLAIGSNTFVLTSNGTTASWAASSSVSAANPISSIGLAAVNGSAGTYMRSDAAPALSQAITPTWSANHIFSSGIYPSYAANGGIGYLTNPAFTSLVPFSVSDWTSDLMTFSPTSILQTNSGSAQHDAYRSYTGGFNTAGKGFYAKYKFKYLNSSQTPVFGVTSSIVSLANIGGMKFSGGNGLVYGKPGGGSFGVTSGYTMSVATTYVMRAWCYNTSNSACTMSYELYDSTGVTLLDSGSTSITSSLTGSYSLGIFCPADTTLGELLDIRTIGIDTDTGGGKITSTGSFCYNESNACVGIGTNNPEYSLDLAGTLRVRDAINLYSVAPSSLLYLDANQNVIAKATTGSGSVVLSASPSFTGTLTASATTLNGTMNINGVATFNNQVSFAYLMSLSSETFSNTAKVITSGTMYEAQTGTMSASRVVTLPAASGYPRGTMLIIADESGTITATNTLVITAAGSDTINGAATLTIGAIGGYDTAILMSNGTSKWTVLGKI